MWDNKSVDNEWKIDQYRLEIQQKMEILGREFLFDEISQEDMIKEMTSLKLRYKAIK